MNSATAFLTLNVDQQAKVQELVQNLTDTMSHEQKTDLRFLGSGLLESYDMQTKQAVLDHLKANEGKITYDDLVDQQQEENQRRSAQLEMLFAMAAAPMVDRMLNGPGGVAFGDNVYDNIEKYGTQGKYQGSEYSWKPPADTHGMPKPPEPGSPVEGAGEASKTPWDSWQNYEKATANGQEYAKVGDRLYSRHAVDRMQPSGKRFTVGDAIIQAGGVSGRSVAPQFVEDVISSVKPVFQPATGNYIYTSGTV